MSTCAALRHGTAWAYNKDGCRCPEAREQWRLYAKRRREGRAPALRLDPTGTQRRIRALMVLGHTSADIGRVAGMHPVQVCAILTSRASITFATRDAICRAYDRLSMVVGPSERTRRRAAAAGWRPPLAWDDIDDPDDVATGVAATPVAEVTRFTDIPRVQVEDPVWVDRACEGQTTPPLTRPLREEAVRRLAAAGLTASEIARRLWWYRGTPRYGEAVRSYCRRHRIPLTIQVQTRKAS